jgi:RNA polymerase sigma-70 factor (ECF subfamily)
MNSAASELALRHTTEDPYDRRPSSANLGFRHVFDLESSRVYRTLCALGVHPASVDDALQDVFIVVHQKLPSFVPEAKLSTWIYAITYRVAQNYRRRTRRTNHAPLSETEECPGRSPEVQVARGQAATFVREFCESLVEEKRDVFVLCVLEQRSAPEVAEMQGVKLNTVYSRLRFVRAEFRSALEKKKDEGRL